MASIVSSLPLENVGVSKEPVVIPPSSDSQVDDVMVLTMKPLMSPESLIAELPLTSALRRHIFTGRNEAAEIIKGEDDRLLVIIGPCSIHDKAAALDYAARLKALADQHREELFIVMRVYFEKPRTTVGWKGLVNDPELDNSYNISTGLRLARSILLEINQIGLHAACELLDTISPQFMADLVTWGAIGARTTESQVHRELASGVSMPVGFKNGTDGRVGIAIDAIKSASHSHHFLGVTKQGLCAIIATKGNENTHIILRGASSGPNYEERFVQEAAKSLVKAGLPDRLMVDCSHGNSGKDPANQIKVCTDISSQLSRGSHLIMGVMIESFIKSGRQDIPKEGKSALEYGKSITDACVSWDETVLMLDELARAVRDRRARGRVTETLR